MYLGRVIESGPTARIFSAPRHPYTQALLESALTPDTRRGLPESTLGPGFPNPLEPPSGCAFHPRCPHAMDVCARVRPATVYDAEGLIECHLHTVADGTRH
jgi:peptide/nickel transport system ATP-binding protein